MNPPSCIKIVNILIRRTRSAKNKIYYSQLQYDCHENSYITPQNRYFKISLFSLFPFHHLTWSFVLVKFNSIQNKIIRIMTRIQKVSCRKVFNKPFTVFNGEFMNKFWQTLYKHKAHT